jgi:hypothetical protein
MKGSVPHHAEKHSFAPGPGKAKKLLTFLSFSESKGGKLLKSIGPCDRLFACKKLLMSKVL